MSRKNGRKRRDSLFNEGRHWYCVNPGCGNKMFVRSGENPNRGGWKCWKCGGRDWK